MPRQKPACQVCQRVAPVGMSRPGFQSGLARCMQRFLRPSRLASLATLLFGVVLRVRLSTLAVSVVGKPHSPNCAGSPASRGTNLVSLCTPGSPKREERILLINIRSV